jgi:uncharacterized protein (TIGR02118 family)
MIQLTVLYGHPTDPAAFDRHYQETHAPLAQKIPGLKGYVVNKPASANPQEPSPYYLIADLYFENAAALQAGFQSAEGRAATADVENFATGGVTMLAGEVYVFNPVAIG